MAANGGVQVDDVPAPRPGAVASRVPALGTGFDAACRAVLDYLQDAVPMGMWSVTRIDGSDQLLLAVAEDPAARYGMESGTVVPFRGSFCERMTAGAARVVPVVEDDDDYRDTPNRALAQVEAYVGIPLEHPDGRVFGSICGFSSQPSVDPDALRAHAPLLDLLGVLLSTVLTVDLERTQAHRLAEWAELQAETDALTGLLNRRGWDRYLGLEEQRYHRFGDPGAIVVLDLDQLKRINDSLGHAAGDAHLRLAAEAMRSCVRESDVLARLGGDEFGIVATRTSVADTRALVERLQGALEEVGVEASFGQAPLTLASGFAGTWRIADEEMYAHKASRRLRVVPGTGRQAGSR